MFQLLWQRNAFTFSGLNLCDIELPTEITLQAARLKNLPGDRVQAVTFGSLRDVREIFIIPSNQSSSLDTCSKTKFSWYVNRCRSLKLYIIEIQGNIIFLCKYNLIWLQCGDKSLYQYSLCKVHLKHTSLSMRRV